MGDPLKRFQRLSLGPLTMGYGNETQVTPRDVQFIVQSRRFSAHIEVLCKVSQVFTTMFRGPFKQERVITVDGVTPEAFELFLKLIYCGTRSTSVNMTPQQSLDCMVIANRYMVDKLEEHLRTKLLRNISYNNVLAILPICDLNLSVLAIRSKCWSVIERNAKQVVNSSQFLSVPWAFLCDILENGRLQINEFELFKAVLRWAAHQATINSVENQRELLGVAIYKLRFPVMTISEFKFVKKTGLLRSGEIEDLEANFRKNTTFPNKLRKYDCQCRRLKTNCRLCVRNKNPSVKGKTCEYPCHSHLRTIKSPRGNRRRPDVRRVMMPTKCAPSVDINSNNISSEPEIVNCDCFKYKSCPAFPNGTTAKLLRRLESQ